RARRTGSRSRTPECARQSQPAVGTASWPLGQFSQGTSPEPVSASYSLCIQPLLEQGVHVGPELLPQLAFGLGQFRQRLLVADAGEVGIGLPAAKGLARLVRIAGFSTRHLFHPKPCVGLEPGEGLLAEFSLLLGVEFVGIFALTTAGQCGGGGGDVASVCCEVICTFGLCDEGVAVEACCCGIELFQPTQLGDLDLLGGIGGFLSPVQNGGKAIVQD